jgi:hypothetical protein
MASAYPDTKGTEPMTAPALVEASALCDGCQLRVLDCEDELLALTDRSTLRWTPPGSPARPER